MTALRERQGGTVTENKQKLIALVSALEEENIIGYCYTFIGLKVYGKTRLPEGITAELRQMWENHFNLPHEDEEQPEPEGITFEEKAAMFYRCEILKAIYDIKNIAMLNCINVFTQDVYKEAQEGNA